MARAGRRGPCVHRCYQNALGVPVGVSALWRSRRSDLPHRGERAVGRRARRHRGVRAHRGPLLAARIPPRSRAPESGERRDDEGNLYDPVAGEAQSDRHVDRQPRQPRGTRAQRQRARLRRRHAASGFEARALPVPKRSRGRRPKAFGKTDASGGADATGAGGRTTALFLRSPLGTIFPFQGH